MKAVITLFAGLLVSLPTLATVDVQTIIYLLTQDVNSEEYDVVGYQYTGCYGIEEGPQAAAFAEPFHVSAPRGCGGGTDWAEDVNALSCAEGEYTWDEAYTYVKAVKLNISTCEISTERMNEFKILAGKAAKKNFKSAEVTFAE